MNANKKSKLSKFLMKREYTMFFVLVAMVIISGIISPTFRSVENIINIFNQNAMIGVMALGMSVVLIGGAFDLSVGSTAALTGIVAAFLFREYGFAAGLLGGLAVGCIIGFINGLLITKIKINSFVATLGMMTIARGLVYIITTGLPVTGVPREFNFIGIGKIGGIIPVAASIWIILAVVLYLIMKHTKFGQYVYALGGNENAAWLSGINTDKIKIFTFVISGLFASLGGLFFVFKVLLATADMASGYELTTIASCIVGGVSLTGGRGNVFGAVIGALILGLILNILQLTGVSVYYQSTITGIIILGAVGIDSFSNRNKD